MILLNLLLIIVSFILYVKLLSYIKNYVKFEYIKRHIYESNDAPNNLYFHPKSFFGRYLGKDFFELFYFFERSINIEAIFSHVLGIIFFLFNRKIIDPEKTQYRLLFNVKYNPTFIEHFLNRYFHKAKYIIHHIILLLLISYDIIFNHFILENMFRFLPVIFIYEIIVRFNKFADTLNKELDSLLYAFLYEKITQSFDYYIMGTYSCVTVEHLQKAIEYAKAGLFYDREKVDNREKAVDKLKAIQLYGSNIVNKIEEDEIKYAKEITSPFLLKVLFWWILSIHIILLLFLCYMYIYINNFK